MAGAILFSKVEEATSRFPDFVSELQGFFLQYGLPVGAAEAVADLAERASTEGAFRDDLVSMICVLCAEEEGISYLELLGLLVVAAVGPETAQDLALDAGAEEPVRRLFNFVVEARRPRPEEELATRARAGNDPDHFVVPESFPAEEMMDVAEPMPMPAIASVVPGRNVDQASRGSVLARALAIAADEDGFGGRFTPEPVPVVPSAPEPVVLSAPVPVVPRAPEPSPVIRSAPLPEPPLPRFAEAAVETASRVRVPVWAVGLGGVLLGLLISFLWQRHWAQVPAVGSAVTAPAAEPAGAALERAAKRRERVARSAQEEVNAAVAGAASAGPERDPEPAEEAPTSRAGSAEAKRSASSGRPASSRASDAPSDRGRVSRSSEPGPSAKAVRPLTGAMVPSVRAVDLNASAEGNTQSPHGARTRMPNVVTGSSGIMAANVISAPAPAYPAQASAARVEGEVVIEAVVGRDGAVKETRVVSGPEMLRQAALYAVQHWHYRPYEVDGTPAEISTTARLQFRLNGE